VTLLSAALALAIAAQEAPRPPQDPFEGLWKPVDLDLKEVGTREAFETLFRKAGTSVELPKDLEEKKLSLQLKGATFWKAFDELCRVHGNLRPLESFRGKAALVEAGPWIGRPAFYQGPFRLSVFDVASVREFRYPGRRDRTDLTLVLTWAPDFTPVLDFMQTAGALRLTRVEDDTGKSLLPPVGGDDSFDFSIHGRPGSPSSPWLLRLQPADPKAARIATVEGEWEGSFLGDLEELRFDNPGECVGKSRNAGPVVVTLKDFGPARGPLPAGRDASYEFRLVLTVDPSAPEAWKEGLKKVPLARRTLWQASYVPGPRFPGDAPEPRSTFLMPLKGPDPLQPELHATLHTIGAPPASLSLNVGKSLRSGSFSFSFKDLRLP